jgi:hypothetical protein
LKTGSSLIFAVVNGNRSSGERSDIQSGRGLPR